MGKIATYFTWRVIYGRIPIVRHVPTLVRCKTDIRSNTVDTVTAHLYVGADNKSGEVDMPVITGILVKRHERGYTVIPGQGCWNGQSEPIVMVVVTGTRQHITDTAHILRTSLNQDAIGLQYVNPMEFV